MAVLKIEKLNSKVLRKKAKDIEQITPEIRKLSEDMIETMKAEKGIGLAAPQVGVSKRIITLQLDPRTGDVFTLINPKIIKKSKQKEIGEEGCLSFPGIFLNISRAKAVEVSATDISGNEITIQAEGISSQALQHEIDHLDGILFFDRLKIGEKVKFKLKYPKIKSIF